MREWLNEPNRNLLFHYTSSATALNGILHSGRIRFGNMHNTNDPYENQVWGIHLKLTLDGLLLNKEVVAQELLIDEIKRRVEAIEAVTNITHLLHGRSQVFCTTQDNFETSCTGHLHRGYTIPSLWAHYGDKHKGVCFAFDKSSLKKKISDTAKARGVILFHDSISYDVIPTNSPAFSIKYDFPIDRAIIEHVREFQKTLLFTKDPSWSPENEFRFVVTCNDDRPFEIDISDSIIGIILGAQFSEVNKPLIFEAYKNFGLHICKLSWNVGWPSIYTWITKSRKERNIERVETKKIKRAAFLKSLYSKEWVS